MFFPISFLSVLLTAVVQCQNITVQFATFPVNTDIGICTCDLTANKCDVSCCCDADCSTADKVLFACSSRDNQYTNTTASISSIQPTCFKNLSIFQSNSPYIIQKMGELVCVDYARYTGSQFYQQPQTKTLNPADFIRFIDTQNSVSAPLALPTNLTRYQVGTPVFTYVTSKTTTAYFSLPIKIFNSQICSGTQSITYMNDFTSTCSQPVNSLTYLNGLNALTYIGPLCLIQSPSSLYDSSTRHCDSTTASAPTVSSTGYTNVLQSLGITIFYSNPTGIQSVNITTLTFGNAVLNTPFQQTFTVKFIKTGSSSSSSSSSRNPGYIQGANIIAGIANASIISSLVSTQFSLLKASSTGICDVNNTQRIPIHFGENVRTTCTQALTSTTTCPFAALNSLIMSINSDQLYVAAYSNSDVSNITSDWLPVISCTSEIGSPTTRDCQNGFIQNPSTASVCYIRLDIQIAYTNIGSILNPQPVLSAIIFHYQRLTISTTTTTLPTTLFVTQSVTFQDISTTPVIVQGQVPTPNTLLPADFFYPFTTSRATKTISFSFLFIVSLFILM